MSRISTRVARIAESATLAIDAKAKAMARAGEDVVIFGAGEPDFPTPDHIVRAAIEACSDPAMHKYSDVQGLPELREAIAAKTKRDSGYVVDPSQILVANGGKQSLLHAFAAILEPSDEVIMPAPYWVTYPEQIQLAGGVPIFIDTDETTGFKATVEQLEAARTPKTKALVFCSPSNPTGAVYTEEEIRAIGTWAAEHGVWIIHDEIYEHLVYGTNTQHSVPVVVPEIADRCLVVNGVAKTYAMTGWRVGWVIGPADVMKAIKNLHSHSSANVCNIAQRATLAAVSGDLEAVATMRTAFDRRRRTIHQMLSDIDSVTCLEPQGAFYAFPNFKGALHREIRGHRVDTTMQLASVVLDEAKVAIVPGEAFGAPGYVRFSYALGDDQLAEGVSRIAKLLAE